MTNLVEVYYELTPEEQQKLDRIYYDYIKTLPCSVTGNPDVGSPHHLRFSGYCGTAKKPPDIFCIPVTALIHIELHSKKLSEVEFMYEVDFRKILKRIHTVFMIRKRECLLQEVS